MKLRHRLTALGILLAMMLALAAPSLAYDFPQPDWTALYNQRWQMVTDTEFGLYAQGPVSSAPYYGAKFEPKAGTYLGTTVDSADNLLPVGSVLTYIYGTSGQDDLYWPSNTMLHNGNMIAMVGWTIEDLNTIDYNYVEPDPVKYDEPVKQGLCTSMAKVIRTNNISVSRGKTKIANCEFMGIHTKDFGETAYLQEELNRDVHWYTYLNELAQLGAKD